VRRRRVKARARRPARPCSAPGGERRAGRRRDLKTRNIPRISRAPKADIGWDSLAVCGLRRAPGVTQPTDHCTRWRLRWPFKAFGSALSPKHSIRLFSLAVDLGNVASITDVDAHFTASGVPTRVRSCRRFPPTAA